jgi:hypothetical protein
MSGRVVAYRLAFRWSATTSSHRSYVVRRPSPTDAAQLRLDRPAGATWLPDRAPTGRVPATCESVFRDSTTITAIRTIAGRSSLGQHRETRACPAMPVGWDTWGRQGGTAAVPWRLAPASTVPQPTTNERTVTRRHARGPACPGVYVGSASARWAASRATVEIAPARPIPGVFAPKVGTGADRTRAASAWPWHQELGRLNRRTTAKALLGNRRLECLSLLGRRQTRVHRRPGTYACNEEH